MARDDERRKSLFDDDEEEIAGTSLAQGAATPGNKLDGFDLDLKLGEIKSLLDQTHQLYQQYFTGVEKRPPQDKARLLESRVAELQRLPLTTQTSRFKISQFILQYKTFRDLWDRKLREREKT